ncbi:MAG: tetratricopeptide repeat protein [Muribaculaceae bacterium]|nr:tetratricopeptide repeat protein [Muribaculaceae bacterium]
MTRTTIFIICIALFFNFLNAQTISEIENLREEADSLHSIGQTEEAIKIGERAIKLAEQSGDKIQIVGTHAAQGVFLRSMGRIDDALRSYDKALEIATSETFRENPNQEAIEEIASLYINLAVLNLDMQNKDQAAQNAKLAGEWVSKSDDAELKSTIFGVVGSVLTGCGDFKDAMSYQTLAYDNALACGDEETAFRAAAYGMLVSDRLGDKSKAEEWRNKCLELMPKISSIMAKLVYYQAECSICLKNNDPKGAIKWFEAILNTEGIDNLPFIQYDCYNNLHIAYSDLGDYEDAYKTLIKSNEVRDSLWQQEKEENLRDLTIKYETQETKLALTESEKKRSEALMWVFISLAILLVFIIVFIVVLNKNRRERLKKEAEYANLRADIGKQLTQQYIEGLENERARMSKELHDGVCNDLLAIEMNIKNGSQQENTTELIKLCRDSVRRISHDLMPPEFNYATIDEVVKYFLNKQQEAYEGKIAIEYSSVAEDAQWTEIPDFMALDIYRIIQEAVGNSLKHSGAGKIEVSMKLKGKHLEVEVKDDGKYKLSNSKGIGLESIQKRAKAINAKIDIKTQAEEGTSLKLNLVL